MDLYHPMIELVEKKTDFSRGENLQLHKLGNAFLSQWVDMFGSAHMTNYLHIVGAGHFFYYIDRYRNLARFANQGWEALNQRFTRRYHFNSNHGGANGTNGISGKHCLPLMRWCLRYTLWRIGFADAHFSSGSIPTTADFDLDRENEDGLVGQGQQATVTLLNGSNSGTNKLGLPTGIL